MGGEPVGGALRPVAGVFGSQRLEGQVLRTGMNVHADPFQEGSLGFCELRLGAQGVKSQALGGIWVGDKQPDPAMGRISIPGKTGIRDASVRATPPLTLTYWAEGRIPEA